MSVIDDIVKGYRESLAATPYGDGYLVSLPSTFDSGNLVTVLVSQEDDVAVVTDRGLTADELALAGLDLTSGRVARSFAAVRDSTGLAPAFGSDEWEITAQVDAGDVAIAVQAVADAAMRADGLRALASAGRPASFGDKTVAHFTSRAAIVPRDRIPGKHGSRRQVTLSYRGNDGEKFYVQALSGRNPEVRGHSYDHASGLFLGAVPTLTHRVALLENGSWESWQVRNLEEVCRVVVENEVDDFVASTAA